MRCGLCGYLMTLRLKQPHLPMQYGGVYTEKNFIVNDCNKSAFDWLKIWPYNNSNNFTCIVGDRYSGKTHLANIWANDNCATTMSKSDVLDFEKFCTTVDECSISNFFIDDFCDIVDDILLYHIFNFITERRCHLLVTAVVPPSNWDIRLDDTVSRLSTIHVERIGNPSDQFEVILRQVLNNYGIATKDYHICRIANSIERSYGAINKFLSLAVEHIDEYGRFSGRLIDYVLGVMEHGY